MKTRPLLIAGLAPLLLAAAPAGELQVDVERLRNGKGVVHACLTSNPRHFPDCKQDPAALKQTVPAIQSTIRFSGIPPGRYALTLFHDENDNQKLDTFLGIPKEGFGFSRNPVVRFGPPKFDQVVVPLGGGMTRQNVRMQYLL